jgi:hypothetical protein
MPVHYFLVVSPEEGDFLVKIFQCRNRDSSVNEVTLCKNEDVVFNIDEYSFAYRQKRYELLNLSMTHITFILSPWKKFCAIDVDREFTVLRGMVYRRIKDELPAVLKHLFQLLSK